MRGLFLKHAFVYGLCTVCIQAGNFLLLPLYLRCLTPAEYGVLEILSRLSENIAALLMLNGFKQALFSFYQQANGNIQRQQIVATAYFLLICFLLFGVFLLNIFLEPMSQLLFSNIQQIDSSYNLLLLAIFIIFLEPFTLFPLTLLQARLQSGTYASILICQFLIRVTLCIFLVRVMQWGVVGILVSMALTNFLFGIFCTIYEFSNGLRSFSSSQLIGMLAFALPLVPGSFCFFILHHGDRFLLLQYRSLEEIGVYSLGYKLAMLIRTFSLEPLYMVWSSHLYTEIHNPDASQFFGRQFNRIISVYFLAGLSMTLFAPDIIYFLAGSAYLDAALYIGPLAIAYGFQSMATLMDSAFYITRSTYLKLPVTLLSTAIILLLYWLLIPIYGVPGAVAATLGGFFILFVVTYIITQRLFPVKYDWFRIVGMIILGISLSIIGIFLPIDLVGLFAKAALLMLALVAAWLLRLISTTDRQIVIEFCRSVLRLLWPHTKPISLSKLI